MTLEGIDWGTIFFSVLGNMLFARFSYGKGEYMRQASQGEEPEWTQRRAILVNVQYGAYYLLLAIAMWNLGFVLNVSALWLVVGVIIPFYTFPLILSLGGLERRADWNDGHSERVYAAMFITAAVAWTGELF